MTYIAVTESSLSHLGLLELNCFGLDGEVCMEILQKASNLGIPRVAFLAISRSTL